MSQKIWQITVSMRVAADEALAPNEVINGVNKRLAGILDTDIVFQNMNCNSILPLEDLVTSIPAKNNIRMLGTKELIEVSGMVIYDGTHLYTTAKVPKLSPFFTILEEDINSVVMPLIETFFFYGGLNQLKYIFTMNQLVEEITKHEQQKKLCIGFTGEKIQELTDIIAELKIIKIAAEGYEFITIIKNKVK